MNKGVKWIGGLTANGGGGEVCRNVSNFNGVDSFAEFDNDIVLSGDFLSRCKFNTNNSAPYGTIFGKELFLKVATLNGQIRLLIGDGAGWVKFSATVDIDENRDYILSIEKTSNIYSLSLDDTVVWTDTVALDTPEISGMSEPVKLFNGKIWDFSVVSDGTLLVDLPMDETSETSTVNYINRTGNTDYNATGYNITVTEECETDASAWNDAEDWVDDEEYID